MKNMVHGPELEIGGSCRVVVLNPRRAKAPVSLGVANDNLVPEAVKTVTVRRTLEKSGVAIKIKVPVAEFVGVAVATRISEEGLLTSTIELVHSDPDLNYRVFRGNGQRQRCCRVAELGQEAPAAVVYQGRRRHVAAVFAAG